MYGFEAYVFEGKKTAGHALDTVEDRYTDLDWIDDVAIVSRGKHGRVKVESTWAQDDGDVGAGAGFGAITGGLLGLLLGPGGALGGAAVGASLGAVFGAAVDVDIDDPRLDEFAEALHDDTSAVILVGEGRSLADFTSAFGSFGGKIVETELDDKDVKAIKKAIRHH